MTSPIIPDYILDLFRGEVAKVNITFLKRLCEMYKIDFEEAKQKLAKDLKIPFEITTNEKIVIIKKQKEQDPELRCIARLFKKKDLEVMQCTRKKKGGELCGIHQKMFDNDKLKYGLITEEVPEELSERILSKINSKALI